MSAQDKSPPGWPSLAAWAIRRLERRMFRACSAIAVADSKRAVGLNAVLLDCDDHALIPRQRRCSLIRGFQNHVDRLAWFGISRDCDNRVQCSRIWNHDIAWVR